MGCSICAQVKCKQKNKTYQFEPLKIATKPRDEIGINIIGKLRSSNKNNFILVIHNRFTKTIWNQASLNMPNLNMIVKSLIEFCMGKLPNGIVTDYRIHFDRRNFKVL
jgi:hypothetical protein